MLLLVLHYIPWKLQVKHLLMSSCFMSCCITFEISSLSDVGHFLSPDVAVWETRECQRGVQLHLQLLIYFKTHVFWSLTANTQHLCFLPFLGVNTHYTRQQRTSTKHGYWADNPKCQSLINYWSSMSQLSSMNFSAFTYKMIIKKSQTS